MKVISLGWGVQSFTLAAMVALGELEPVDAAIHADTTHERSATYEFRAKYEGWLQEHGVNVITVCDYDAANKPYGVKTENMPAMVKAPLFTTAPDGKAGIMSRTCTHRWKIEPQNKWLRSHLKLLNIPRKEWQVEKWFGISLDEVERMKPSQDKWITNRWPLIEKRMTRHDCANWLINHGLEVPPKSACVFCPFHNRRAWLDMKNENRADWKKAIEADNAVRNARPPYKLFVHSKRIPLTDIVDERSNGQLDLFASEECSGVCFV